MAEIEHDTGHDVHFLARLERVTVEDMDLALRLYRGPKLVARILGDAAVPAGAERVAIALSGAEPPPYVLVERSGAFVTCLAAGMTPGELPVVPWERVSLHLGRADREAQRREVALAVLHREGGGKQLVRRIFLVADRLTREDMLELIAVEPFLRRHFLYALERSYKDMRALGHQVARLRRPRPADEPLYRRLWAAYWSFAHLAVLLGVGGRQRFEGWSGLAETERDGLVSFFLAFFAIGDTPLGLRMMWLMARIGKPLLAPLKRALARAITVHRWMAAAMSLFALACGQRKLRAEVLRALSVQPAPSVAPEDIREAMVQLFRHVGEPIFSDEETFADFAGPYMRERAAMRLGGRERRPDLVDEDGLCDADVALPVAVQRPGVFLGDGDEIMRALSLLPAVTTARAEDLYLPAARIANLAERFSMERVQALAASWRPDGPVRAAAAPGRNEPCPCGSGKKYKRCCLGGSPERP